MTRYFLCCFASGVAATVLVSVVWALTADRDGSHPPNRFDVFPHDDRWLADE